MLLIIDIFSITPTVQKNFLLMLKHISMSSRASYYIFYLFHKYKQSFLISKALARSQGGEGWYFLKQEGT